MEVLGPLSDPAAHGGRAEDAFHLVVPSLPGYGFSAKPTEPGWNIEHIAAAWPKLMRRLGYDRWVAQGGDWGAIVTNRIGSDAPEGCAGIHVNLALSGPTEAALKNPTDEELAAFERMKYYQDWDSGYSKQQSTRPQSVGYSLVDSPVGLAGWIYEKMWSWTDNQGQPEDALSRDTILDNIMLYWLTESGASSARLYWESFGQLVPGDILMPSGISNFPKEITTSPRSWVEQRMKHLVYWNDLDKGGHFAAWEQPEIFVDELRKCFALMR
jgi:pimeloyl-ACP methyl ester carboxylesterase